MSLLINPPFPFIVLLPVVTNTGEGILLTLSLEQGPLFTSVNQSETCN